MFPVLKYFAFDAYLFRLNLNLFYFINCYKYISFGFSFASSFSVVAVFSVVIGGICSAISSTTWRYRKLGVLMQILAIKMCLYTFVRWYHQLNTLNRMQSIEWPTWDATQMTTKLPHNPMRARCKTGKKLCCLALKWCVFNEIGCVM